MTQSGVFFPLAGVASSKQFCESAFFGGAFSVRAGPHGAGHAGRVWKLGESESVPLVFVLFFHRLECNDVLKALDPVGWQPPRVCPGAGRGVGVSGVAGLRPWHGVRGTEPSSARLHAPGRREAKGLVCVFTRLRHREKPLCGNSALKADGGG